MVFFAVLRLEAARSVFQRIDIYHFISWNKMINYLNVKITKIWAFYVSK